MQSSAISKVRLETRAEYIARLLCYYYYATTVLSIYKLFKYSLHDVFSIANKIEVNFVLYI